MAYTPISQVFITLSTPLLTGEDFSVPLFAATDFSMFEEYTTFTGSTDAGSLVGTDSNFYAAALQIFNPTPSLGYFYGFRRRADAVFTLATDSVSPVISLGYKDEDGLVKSEVFLGTLPGGLDSAAEISAAINASDNFTGKLTATSSGESIVIETIVDGSWKIDSVTNDITVSAINKESAADLITRISESEVDYYFFASDDHDEEFILSAAAALAAAESPSIYFVSSDDPANLSGGGLLKLLSEAGLDRVALFYQQDADESFPECNYLGYNAPYLPGVPTWGNLRLSLPAGINTSTGKRLNSGEKSVLEALNVAYMEPVGSSAVLRGGKTALGESIETIRGRDAMESDMKIAHINLLASQQGGKLPYTNPGITSIIQETTNVIQKYVNRLFVKEDFKLNFLMANAVPLADKAANIYQSGSFEAELVGSILSTKIYGNLSLQL